MKKLLVLLIAAPLSVFAEDMPMPPMPGTGLKIIPLSQVHIPESMKKDVLNNIKEQKEKGYIESTVQNDSVRFLIDVQKNSQMHLPLNLMAVSIGGVRAHEEANNELKNTLADIKLTFPYSRVPEFDKQNDVTVLSYTGCGGYDKNNLIHPGAEGWTGIKIFFTSPTLGSCAYTFLHVNQNEMAAELNTESTEYLVNKKPSSKVIEGNTHGGFSYSLDWFSKDGMENMECANLKFDKQIMDKMVELANKVDKK